MSEDETLVNELPPLDGLRIKRMRALNYRVVDGEIEMSLDCIDWRPSLVYSAEAVRAFAELLDHPHAKEASNE